MSKNMYMALTTTEIRSIVARISHRLGYKAKSLQPKEISFLMDIHYKLKEQRRTSLSCKQLSWLLTII
jgi:hypothetical protein